MLLYEEIANGLVDDGYILIDKALSSTLIDKLFILSQDNTHYKKAAISNIQNRHLDNTKRSDKTKWIDEDAGVMSEYLDFCKGLQVYLNRSLYLGLTYYEAHFAIYEEGAFYEKHLDAFKGSTNRVVTTLLYLNDMWHKEDGGELLLYDKNNNLLEKIMPKGNTLLVFLSDRFPHEVLPTKKKRHSIAGWFRVDKR